MTSTRRRTLAGLIGAIVLFAGCSSPGESNSTAASDGAPTKTIKVAAVTSPMTDVVQAAGEAIEPGYSVELVEINDYVMANKTLNDGDVDANFSQHVPYMNEFNAKNNGTLVAVQPVYNFIIAFYSKTLTDINDLPTGAKVAIPDDSANAGRALKLLASKQIITLDPSIDPYQATVKDITENPKDLQFLQVAISQLNTAYDEVDLVFQWPSHIKALGLTPQADGLLTELDDRFALNLVVRAEDENSEATAALKKAFTSDKVRAVIESNNTIVAAF